MTPTLLFPAEKLAGVSDRRLYRGLLFAVAEAAVTSASYGVVFLFTRRALDGSLRRADLLPFSLTLLALVLAQTLLARPAFAGVFLATFSLMGRARIRLLDHLRTLPLGFFSTRRAGELAGALTTDIALVEDVWAHLFALFTAGLLLPIFVGGWLCWVDWRLGLSVFITLPVALLILVATLPLLTRRVQSVLEALADANARIVEYVQGAAVLRAFGRYGEGFERLRASLERLRQTQVRTELAPAPLIAAYGFTVDMGFVLVALVGSHFLLGGTLTAPNLLVFLLVAAGVSRRLFDFGTGLLQLRTAQAALARVQTLLDEPALAEPAQAPAALQRFDIELEDVRFAYDLDTILTGISALIPARRLTALVGRSGSGKSTLVHLIARLWDVKRGSGAIRVGGVDIRDLPFEMLHRYISLVFQDVVLFSGTILENIRIGKPSASQAEVEAAARAAQAHEFISALSDGYQTAVGEGGGSLSGGEKQRISIARAILKDAPIVLLDEATASVDAFAEAELQRAIDELVRTRTVVVIAHHLKTIQYAHQILVLDKGAIAERGTHAELLAAGGVYAGLWARQASAKSWLHAGGRERPPEGRAAAGAGEVVPRSVEDAE